MNKAYTDEANIESYLGGITIVSGEADLYILATQKYIDSITGRNFKADTVATARLYSGNGRDAILIDDCVEVTLVEQGQDAWGDNFTEVEASGSSKYFTLPTNNAVDEIPIRKIGLRSGIFSYGHANHRITAKWGWSADVPDDIAFVATVLASGMYYQNKGENSGAIKSEKIGEYQVSYSEQGGFNDMQKATEILASYKKIEL